MITASIIAPILRVMTPILLCALGGVYSERSGTGNITYEGSMLVGTFTVLSAAILPEAPWLVSSVPLQAVSL